MGQVSLPTLDSLVPKEKALRDKVVQGHEGYCIIFGKLSHISVASAVKWDGHGEAQGGAW